jgi:hypothetical protein
MPLIHLESKAARAAPPYLFSTPPSFLPNSNTIRGYLPHLKPHTITMASLPYPRLSRIDFVDLKTRLFRRVHAHAVYLDERWQEYCSTKYSRRVRKVQERDPDLMHTHRYYGQLNGVQYYDIFEAQEGYRAGPFRPGDQLEERLRKAVLTWNTCIDVAVAVWEYLEMVLKGVFIWW